MSLAGASQGENLSKLTMDWDRIHGSNNLLRQELVHLFSISEGEISEGIEAASRISRDEAL